MPEPTILQNTPERPVAALRARLPELRLDDDPATLELYGTDILGPLAAPVAVAQPRDRVEVIALVRACAELGVPICARGGGASYTHAHVPAKPGAVVLDCAALDRIVRIDADAMTVTVEPGVTWQALDAALVPLGVRTPFWGPFSGLRATIGGSLSQHAISLGSGLYDTSAGSVVALQVVTGRGELIDTATSAARFYRSSGPDLTGLFLGDSGAFGIKLEATLRLIRRPTHVAACAFMFPDFGSMARGMMAVARENLASEVIAIDPELQRGQLGRMDTRTLLTTLRSILRSSPGPLAASAAMLRAAAGARGLLGRPGFLVNVLAEGRSRLEARARIGTLRGVLAASGGGVEVADTLALALRADPFRPFTPMLGPGGERWLPIHGVLPFPAVEGCHQELVALYERFREPMQRHGVRLQNMYVTAGANGFVYEPTLLWPDSQHAAHRAMMPEDYRRSLPVHEDNPAGRSCAMDLKAAIVEVLAGHGAAFYQLGKAYPFLDRRDTGARSLLEDLKSRFDPDGILNPGVLGFRG